MVIKIVYLFSNLFLLLKVCYFKLLIVFTNYRYVQYILITTGVYASRIWTAAIAATLLFLSSRSLSFVENMQKWFYPIGWGYVNINFYWYLY